MDECFPDQISNDYLDLAHNCHADANCSNSKGSFYCTCHTGYSGDGVVCLGIIFPRLSIFLSSREKWLVCVNKLGGPKHCAMQNVSFIMKTLCLSTVLYYWFKTAVKKVNMSKRMEF